MMLLLFLMIIFIIMLFVVLALMKNRKKEEFDNCVPRIFQFNGTFDNYENSDQPTFPFLDVANKYNIEIVKKFTDANLIFFSDYTLYDQNFDKIKYKEKCNYKIFAINGIDLLANKKTLSEKLKGTGLVPRSYQLDDEVSINSLVNDHYDDKLYIVKSNIQRQEGLKITRDIDYIINKAKSDNFVVAQELLQDPMLVNGRKINIRIYLLIVIKGNVCDWWIYHDGFMYYAPEFFVKGDESPQVNITSGFIDRKVYAENPLTLQDLYQFIGNRKATLLQKNIEKLFSKVRSKYKDDFVALNKSTPGIKFCLYGCDVAPNENLDVLLIEVNKGPSINGRDKRDAQLKYNLIKDALGCVHIISGDTVNPDNFIQIKNY